MCKDCMPCRWPVVRLHVTKKCPMAVCVRGCRKHVHELIRAVIINLKCSEIMSHPNGQAPLSAYIVYSLYGISVTGSDQGLPVRSSLMEAFMMEAGCFNCQSSGYLKHFFSSSTLYYDDRWKHQNWMPGSFRLVPVLSITHCKIYILDRYIWTVRVPRGSYIL